MIDFSQLNGKLKESNLPASARFARSLLDSADKRRSAVQNAAESYARSYVMVQELTVNADGNVVDQTDDTRKSVATNNLRNTQLTLKQSIAETKAIKEQLNSVQPVDANVEMNFKVPRSVKTWDSPKDFYTKAMNLVDNAESLPVLAKKLLVIRNLRSYYLDSLAAQEGNFGSARGFNCFAQFMPWVPEKGTAMRMNLQVMYGEDSGNPLDGATFAVTCIASTTGESKHMVITTCHIPEGSINANVLNLMMPVVLGSEGSESNVNFSNCVAGWALRRKPNVDDVQIDDIAGAREFITKVENKVFCGVTERMSPMGYSIYEIHHPSAAGASQFICDLTEVPFYQVYSDVADKLYNALNKVVTSPALKAAFPSMESFVKLSSDVDTQVYLAMLFTRSYPILFSKALVSEGSDGADAVRLGYMSPMTAAAFGYARQWQANINFDEQTYYDELVIHPNWILPIQHEAYVRGYTGTIDVWYDKAEDAINFIPNTDYAEDTTTSLSVKGSAPVGDQLLSALLYDNQEDIESVLLSL